MRVAEETHRTLRELSEATGRPMQDVISDAVTAYWRHRLLEETNAAYATLRADEKGRAAAVAERAEWEATLGDTGQLEAGSS